MTTLARAAVPATYAEDFRLFEESAKGQPDWLKARRRQAFERFAAAGFPVARRGNEPWKYTNLNALARQAFRVDVQARTPTVAQLRTSVPWSTTWERLVFVNGTFAPGLSSSSQQAHTLRHNLSDSKGNVREYLGQAAGADADAFTALNTAFLVDGAHIQVAPSVEIVQPIHLVFITTGQGATVAHPRGLIVLGRASRATIIESHVQLGGAGLFTNALTEVFVGEGAQLNHHRVVHAGTAWHIGATVVRQGRDSHFVSTALCPGGELVRIDTSVLLEGSGAQCELRGLSSTNGSEHVDIELTVDHIAPHTSSKQYYKGILDGHSRGVFGGRVIVREQAVKAEAQQSDKNLLLSDGAEVDTKPSLEIYTDDVKCNHGATAGQMDPTSLFYLMSRGLTQDEARRLLVEGFARDITDRIEVEGLRRYAERLFIKTKVGAV